MIQTNYYIQDFLNIDSASEECNKTLWVSGKPVDAKEQDGVITILVPFYKQEIEMDDISRSKNTEPVYYHLSLAAYGDKVLRVVLEDEKKKCIQNSKFLLNYSKEIKQSNLQIERKEDIWNILDDKKKIRASIHLKNPEINFWSDLIEAPDDVMDITFFPGDNNKKIQLSTKDLFFPKRKGSLPLAFIKEGDKITQSTFSFHAEKDECFCGTGERFSKLDLSGKTIDLINQDGQGVNSRRTYKNVPFYISSRMYGFFLNSYAHCKFSFADQSTRAVQILNEEDSVDSFLIAGDSIEEIQLYYRQLTGFPRPAPLWSYGIWMSKMTYESAKEINGIVDKLRDKEYPFDVIHIDTGWFRKDWLCEWKFSNEKFPDPKMFIKNLNDKGIRISLWQMPYIAKEAEQCDEAVKNKYIGRPQKTVKQSGSNFGVADYEGTIDFTNPEAVYWYMGLLRELLEMGVSCIKTDFGEEIHMDATYHGLDAKLLHNLYPLLYQSAAAEVTKEITGDAIIWARAGWAGCQRYPVHWGGDAAASWDGMAGSLKGALHLGLSGFAYWSSDIPGFHGVPDFMNSVIPEDLYVRWTQFSVFSSHMRYHGTSNREPYHFPDIEPVIREWWTIRYALIPYIQKLGKQASCSGFPFIRSLIFNYPEDKVCWHIDDQYLFGDSFLVAPVFNSEGIRDIYLPEGEWVNFHNGETTTGGVWLRNQSFPLNEMPVWIKMNETLPVYPYRVNNTDEMDMSKVIEVKVDESYAGIKDTLSGIKVETHT